MSIIDSPEAEITAERMGIEDLSVVGVTNRHTSSTKKTEAEDPGTSYFLCRIAAIAPIVVEIPKHAKNT